MGERGSHLRQLLAELYHEGIGRALAFYTVETWLAEWLGRKEKKVKPSTLHLYKLAAKEFLEWLGGHKDDRLECVSRDDVSRFVEQVGDRGRTAKTSNQFKKSLFNAFKMAAQAGLILQNPVDGVEDLPEDDSTARQPFTLEEVGALHAAASPEWRGVILLGAYAGLRLRDATQLRWASVDLLKGELRFEPLKQRRSKKIKLVLRVRMHRLLREAIEALPSSDDPEAPVFPSLVEKPTGGNGGLCYTFSSIMSKAGIDPLPSRRRAEGAARTVNRRSFHSLRHFCNSAMADAGVPQEIRRQIVGHSSDDVNDIYTHWKADKLAEAIDVLPEF